MTNIWENIDLVIASLLLLGVLFLFFNAQADALPTRNVAFLIASLAGFLGLSLFRARCRKIMLNAWYNRENELSVQENRLRQLRKMYTVSSDDLSKIQAEMDRHRAAFQKEILLIDKTTPDDIKQIDAMTNDEVFEAFDGSSTKSI